MRYSLKKKAERIVSDSKGISHEIIFKGALFIGK